MTSKELGAAGSSSRPTTTTATATECCMCGDYGLPYELFRCNLCYFRSQHRYCSNLYPKAQSYRLCNWCLNKDESNIQGTQHNNNSSSSSPLSHKYNIMINHGEDRDHDQHHHHHHHHQKYININNNEKMINNNTSSEAVSHLKIQISRSSCSDINSNFNNNPIKKQRCLDRLSSLSPSGRSSPKNKIIISGGGSHTNTEESLRRTKSDEISNNATTPTKQGFRGKARRYRLLEEVSSQ